MDILSDVKISGNLDVSSVGLTNGRIGNFVNGVRFVMDDEGRNTVRLTRFLDEGPYAPASLVVESFCVIDNFNLLQFSTDGIIFGRGVYQLCMDSEGMRLFHNGELVNSFEPYKHTINHIEVPAECMRFFIVSDNDAYYTNISVWDTESCKKVEMDITLICGQGIVGEISSPFGNNKRLAVVYDNFS